MIALDFPKVKDCMAKLLLSNTFDNFYLISAEIVTATTFTIDGFLKKEFYEDGTAPNQEYALWKEMREHCFSYIKGHRTPLRFSFVLGLSAENIERLLDSQELPFGPKDVRGLYMNIRFDGQSLICTTGTAMHTFTMDKSLEQVWDGMVKRFLTQKGLVYEES